MQTEQQRQLSPRVRQLLSTRRGIVTVAAGAAVLGGAILILFLSAYRDSLTGADGTQKVLVARVLIEPGSPSDALASENMYETTSVEKVDIESGALHDPAAIKGEITKATIYPGEQLTSSDFRPQENSLADQIRGRERAISLPFTTHAGLQGDLEAGDRVDVIGLFQLESEATGRERPVAKILLQDALVLKIPDSSGGAGAADDPAVIIRATDQDATDLAFTAEYGKLWLAQRPQAGAKGMSKPSPTAVEHVVFGLPPIPVRDFRRQLGDRR